MSSPAEMIAAVKAGDLDRVNELISQDGSLASARDENGASVLMIAVYYGHPTVADALAGRREGQLDIFEATIMGYRQEVERLLIADPSLASSFSADGFNPLQFASYFGKADVARVLLERGADPNVVSRNAMKVAPLHSALAGGYIEIAVTLLEHGADAAAQAGEGWVPLHYAADIGDADIARLLLQKGAKGGVPNDAGKTPEQLGDEVGHSHVSDVIRAGG